MQLYDKDLLSIQEVRELVGTAKKAQQELAEKTQAEVDRIVRSIADAGVRNARRLAQMAHEDTGFGIVDDKVIKNVFASRGVYEYIKDLKTIGELEHDEEKKLRVIAVPVGVIAGLMPSLTLGCGAIGGSATSENVGPLNLLNRRYVAYGTCELEDIRKNVPDCSDGICKVNPAPEMMDPKMVDEIVARIIARLQTVN